MSIKSAKKLSLVSIGIILLSIVLLMWYIGGKATGADDMASIPQANDMPLPNNFNLSVHIKSIHPEQLREQFPYEIYLDSADHYHFSSIQSQIQIMDTLFPGNNMGNLEILSIAMTEKLKTRIEPALKTYHPDSLLMLLQWAEKFKPYAEADEQHAILFNSIYAYWLDFVANKLNKFYEADRSLKYSSKFSYLANRCYEQKFAVPIDNSKFEKVIRYFSETQFAYLYNRFWNGTGIWIKTGILALLLITLYGYYLLIVRIINYFKTK